MIFVGDIAIPNNSLFNIEMPDYFTEKHFWGNLEGPIIDQEEEPKDSLYNSVVGFNSLVSKLNFKGFSLANNHITDLGDFESTIKFLKSRNFYFNGANSNIKSSTVPARINYKSQQISIFGFGWEVIQCQVSSEKKYGVNPLKRSHVLNSIKDELYLFPNNKIIVQFHWNYELELYPQPFDREFSFELIDLGVDAIIGCHSHRAQGIEMYKGKPIVYGLGNWFIPHNMFFNGTLQYPGFTRNQIAFEYDPLENGHLVHLFELNKYNELSYIETSKVENSNFINLLTPYLGMSNSEYKIFFKENRFQKKLLPIFYFEDSDLLQFYKFKFVQIRHVGIKIIYSISKNFKRLTNTVKQ